MPWRYQPVIMKQSGEDYCVLIAVYGPVGKPEVLASWTSEASPVYAEGRAEMVQVLAVMLNEAMAWKPVRYEELKSGLVFERDESYQRQSPKEIFAGGKIAINQ